MLSAAVVIGALRAKISLAMSFNLVVQTRIYAESIDAVEAEFSS